jgi:hypothetical protein
VFGRQEWQKSTAVSGLAKVKKGLAGKRSTPKINVFLTGDEKSFYGCLV